MNAGAKKIRVAMLGSFPPQIQGIPEYCGPLVSAISHHADVTALGFKNMYPAWLFPGEKRAMDPVRQPPNGPYMTVRHRLAWYNPAGWLFQAMTARVDILHVQWWSLPLFPVAFTAVLASKFLGRKIVVTVHNALSHEASPGFLRATRWMCRWADHLIVHSEQNVRQLLEVYGMEAARITRIPHGAAMTEARSMPREAARNELGLPRDAVVFLNFGMIRPYKGVDILLRAFADVVRRYPQAHLVIAGKPWTDWAPYQQQIEEAGMGGHVHLFLEYIPEARVPVFISAVDLIVAPYVHFDAQSGVGMLAMPCRKPLLVSDTGGLPEWVAREPRWVVPKGDAQALADRLGAFLENPAEATVAFQAVADQVLAECNWDHIALRHLEVYKRVLTPAE